MKWTKILGIVLLMHLLVISTLLVNPGCKWFPQQKQPTHSAKEGKWGNPSFVDKPMQTATSYGKSDKPWNTKLDTPRDKPTSPILIEQFDSPGEDTVDALNGVAFDEKSPAPLIAETSVNDTLPKPPSGKVHFVAKGDSLWKIAKQYNIPLSDLLQANAINRDSILSIGQEIIIPASVRQTSSYTIAEDRTTEFTYTVRSGDSLSKIAQRYKTTVSAIKQNNGLTSDTIRIGQVLNVHGQSSSTVIDTPSTPSSTSIGNRSSNNAIISEEGTHIVRPGETPGKIAKQYNLSTQALMEINNITDPRKLRVGTKLIIDPSKASKKVSEPEPTVLPEIDLQKPVLPPALPVNPWEDSTRILDEEEAAPIIPVQEEEEEGDEIE